MEADEIAKNLLVDIFGICPDYTIFMTSDCLVSTIKHTATLENGNVYECNFLVSHEKKTVYVKVLEDIYFTMERIK